MLDATLPLDSELVSTLASYLRATRAQVNTIEASIVGGAIPTIATAANADTSPSVDGVVALQTANAGATLINYLDDGFEGQLVVIVAGDDNTTIQHDVGLIQLTNLANVKLLEGEAILLCFQDSVWREVGGRKRWTFKVVTDLTYQMLVTDSCVLGNAASGNQVFTLPLTTDVGVGHEIKVKKTDSTANTVGTEADATEVLDDSSGDVTLTLQGESASFISDGAGKWWKFN